MINDIAWSPVQRSLRNVWGILKGCCNNESCIGIKFDALAVCPSNANLSVKG